MIIDKVSRVFGTGRLGSLVLEVFAIFLGISASFAVDEWREKRQDVETFEHYLEAIYYDATRERSITRRGVYANNRVIAALGMLMEDAGASVSDEVLASLVGMIVLNLPTNHPRSDGSYQALLSADLALPLDDTLLGLNDLYALRDQFLTYDASLVASQNLALFTRLNQQGALLNTEVYAWNEAERSVVSIARRELPLFAGINKMVFKGDEREFIRSWAEQTRRLLRDPDTQSALSLQLHNMIALNDVAVSIMGINENIQAVVLERLPGLTLPVKTLGLLGSATEGGWLVPRATPLLPDHEMTDWWSAEMTLADGMAKFIANENYGTSWGTDYAWDVIDPLANPTHFLGDPDAVFPAGVGEVDGQNIPIRAGRYRVRFNIRTFEYSFDPVSNGD